jgi:hypothetical protein
LFLIYFQFGSKTPLLVLEAALRLYIVQERQKKKKRMGKANNPRVQINRMGPMRAAQIYYAI